MFQKTLPRYYGDGCRENLLQLHDNRTMWRLDNPNIDDTNSADYDEMFQQLVGWAVKKFEKDTGVILFLEGRSGRHVCVEDTPENSRKFTYLKDKALKLEKEVIKKFNELKL